MATYDIKSITLPNGDVANLRDDTKSAIIADHFTKDNISINANTTSTGHTANIAKSGYTPIFVNATVGNASSSGINSSLCCVYTCSISGNNAAAEVRNHGSAAAKIRITWHVLYTKN